MSSFNFHSKRHRKVPGLSTTATADISFILLVFFLMVTSMDSEKGLLRQINQPEEENIEKVSEIDKRNVLDIKIAGAGDVFCNDEEKPVEDIQARVADFILTCPQPQKHIITLEVSPDADYDSYFQVQNKLILAYRQVHETAAQKKYNAPFKNLNDDQQKKIKQQYPQRIAEK